MALVGIALPVIMHCVSISTRAAGLARNRSEATALAQNKLSEMITLGGWQQSASGGFDPPWTHYRWETRSEDWVQPGVKHFEVFVIWDGRDPNNPEFVRVATLIDPATILSGQNPSGGMLGGGLTP